MAKTRSIHFRSVKIVTYKLLCQLNTVVKNYGKFFQLASKNDGQALGKDGPLYKVMASHAMVFRFG